MGDRVRVGSVLLMARARASSWLRKVAYILWERTTLDGRFWERNGGTQRDPEGGPAIRGEEPFSESGAA